MNSTRKIAVVTGVVFIIATVAALLAAALTPVLTGADYLTRFSAQTNQVAAGALLYLIAAFASAGIAVVMYPVLKKWNAGLALGSVIFRTLEAALYMAAVVCLLSLLTLSQQLTSVVAAERASLGAVGGLLVSLWGHATLAAVFAFSLGAFLYYYVMFQSGLVPRWLSGWGIAATILMLAACLLSLFSDSPVTGYGLLILPIAVQEMVLAVWLIVKGFSPSAIASGPAEVKTMQPVEPVKAEIPAGA
jgi:hypothetical protein